MTRLVLVIVDGGQGVLGPSTTPAWTALPHRAVLATVPKGLPTASEVAIPALLGRRIEQAPARGAVEAAAIGIVVPPGQHAWRLDLDQAPTDAVATAEALSKRYDAAVIHLRRNRFCLIAAAGRRPRAVAPGRLWGGGPRPTWEPLPQSTTLVAAGSGAAAGVARLLGATVDTPPGATGFPDTDLTAKASAALGHLAAGTADLLVVHVGGVDEAGHQRDPRAQAEAAMAVDAEIVAPLKAACDLRGLPLMVVPDHATDARTGRHVPGPVTARASVPIVDGPAWSCIPGLLGDDARRGVHRGASLVRDAREHR